MGLYDVPIIMSLFGFVSVFYFVSYASLCIWVMYLTDSFDDTRPQCRLI